MAIAPTANADGVRTMDEAFARMLDADTHVEGFPPDDERFLPPHRGGCARASDEEEICLSFEPGTTDGRESPDGHPSQQHTVDPGAD